MLDSRFLKVIFLIADLLYVKFNYEFVYFFTSLKHYKLFHNVQLCKEYCTSSLIADKNKL